MHLLHVFQPDFEKQRQEQGEQVAIGSRSSLKTYQHVQYSEANFYEKREVLTAEHIGKPNAAGTRFAFFADRLQVLVVMYKLWMLCCS